MNRWQVIALWLNGHNPKTGAEIGVKEGRFISYLLTAYKGLTMYAVDPWEDQPGEAEDYIGWNWNDIYKEYRRKVEPYAGRFIELRTYSEQAAEQVPDGSLDFVFIDAQHDYESVKQDIGLWFPKVRTGGLISGHDYCKKFPGAMQAVNEVFGRPMAGPNDVWGVWV